MNKTTLNLIADAVLNGNPEPACALPPESQVRVHILVARKAKASGSLKNIYGYLKSLPRFQCALMWKILMKIYKDRDRIKAWYHSNQALIEVVCNSLFCYMELHNGEWVKDNSPVLYKAKCESLDTIMAYEIS
jgi:hypothetical protein